MPRFGLLFIENPTCFHCILPVHPPFPDRHLDGNHGIIEFFIAMLQTSHQTARRLLSSMVFGTGVSFILHGITCCQLMWYFRTQSGRSKTMMAYITFSWIGEALNCMFMFFSTLDVIFLPATPSSQCGSWAGPTQIVASSICTFSAEGFFIMRVWKLSEHKKLTALVLVPYLTGYAFAVAQIVRSYRVLCDPSVSGLNPVFVFGTFGCRLVGDGIIAVTMCYILRKRSSGFTRHANTIKIVRGLILWSISTGVLTWITSGLFLVSYAGLIPSGYSIYYIRGGLYVNAMIAQLNARVRFQTIAEESIPLSTINLGNSTSSQPYNRESHPA